MAYFPLTFPLGHFLLNFSTVQKRINGKKFNKNSFKWKTNKLYYDELNVIKFYFYTEK